jgi:U6 snRNA phosphodiesterase
MSCRSSFTASFAAFSDLTNDEHTRTFFCMEVGAGHQEV